MKVISKIAGNELRHLFYSPIAWFLLIVFWVQAAVIYTNIIVHGANYEEVMIQNSAHFKGAVDSITWGIFIKSGFFQTVIRNLYLFIPLLTMGLISHELNTGSIKLLYSSPVTIRQIVLGKYLGIVIYNLLMVLIVAAFVITGAFNIAHIDYGLLLSALLSFYLIVCAYSAIGLFMSGISTYPIVSVLSSFAVIFILGRIGTLWQQYDVIRDLTYFLSLQNRTGNMQGGLISSKDLVYFIVVALLFVGLTILKLQSAREAAPWYKRAARYIGLLGSALAIGYITSRPALIAYWDTSATKRNTIHHHTQQLLKKFSESTLEVTLYANLLGGGIGHGLPEARNIDYLTNCWERYLRFKPDIMFRYEYYYDLDETGRDSLFYKSFAGKPLRDIAAQVAGALDVDLSFFKSPDEIHKTIDLRPEAYRLVMQLKYKGRTEFLRTFDDPFFWPDEVNVSAALKRLLHPQPPSVYFVTGELERSIYKTGERAYANHTAMKAGRGSLVNIGFDVDTLHLLTHDIPKNATMLVLADPKMKLAPAVQRKLRNYVQAGGNMMVTAEPGKQYVLNPFLNQLGIQLMDGQLVQPSYDETPDKIISWLTAASSDLSRQQADVNKSLAAEQDTGKILMPGATAVYHSNDQAFMVKPVACTLPGKAWLKAGKLVADSTLPEFNAAAGDIWQNTFPTVVQLTRRVNQKVQRIIVFGDGDALSNARLGANYYFVTQLYSWLNYNRDPVYLPRPKAKDVYLTISNNGAEALRIAYLWVLPALTLISGIILIIRRKRK